VSGVYHGIQVYNKLAHIKHSVLCQSVVINYVSEHKSLHIVNASHTTLIIHVNQGLMLLKLIGWRHCPCFRWVLYILGITAQTLLATQSIF